MRVGAEVDITAWIQVHMLKVLRDNDSQRGCPSLVVEALAIGSTRRMYGARSEE